MALRFWNGAALALVVSLQGCSSTETKPDAAAPTGYGRGGAAQVGRYDPADAAAQGQQRARGAADAAMGYRAPSERVIYFEYDSDDVLPEYVPLVNAHAAFLSANPKRVATLEGHADERGSSEYNVGLGEQRARAVARMLGLQGVSEGQLQIVSYGEEKAADFGHDEVAWQRNRRVEINYTGR
ncbi:peptidoglycan-associated lipoprotein Pal [Methylolobus aquaticus]